MLTFYVLARTLVYLKLNDDVALRLASDLHSGDRKCEFSWIAQMQAHIISLCPNTTIT